MDEFLAIYSYDLTTTVYVAVSIASLIANASVGLWLVSRDPQPRWAHGWGPAAV